MTATLSVFSECRTPLPEMHFRIDSTALALRPGLILDRDGVLVDFVDYLHQADRTRLAEGSADLISRMKAAGVAVGVVTNQAGIARSLYQWSHYFAVEEEIDRQLSAAGAALDGIVACPFHPDFTQGWCDQHSYWRKPGPGMIELLLDRLKIDRRRCWLIGDHISDIKAANAAGLPGAILVQQGWGAKYRDDVMHLASASFEVVVIEAINQAATILIDRMGLE
jgi:D-glycero-D-manno-heptose 1,7-bisphosphate phosphatase